jgi:hypothetical protein
MSGSSTMRGARSYRCPSTPGPTRCRPSRVSSRLPRRRRNGGSRCSRPGAAALSRRSSAWSAPWRRTVSLPRSSRCARAPRGSVSRPRRVCRPTTSRCSLSAYGPAITSTWIGGASHCSRRPGPRFCRHHSRRSARGGVPTTTRRHAQQRGNDLLGVERRLHAIGGDTPIRPVDGLQVGLDHIDVTGTQGEEIGVQHFAVARCAGLIAA